MKLMSSSLTDDDLREACLALDMDYENLEGKSKRARIISLIKQCEKGKKLAELLEICAEINPKAGFKEFDWNQQSIRGAPYIKTEDKSARKKMWRLLKQVVVQLRTSAIGKAIVFAFLMVLFSLIIVTGIRFLDPSFLTVNTIPETLIPLASTTAPTLSPVLPTNTSAPILTSLSPTNTVAVALLTETETKTPWPSPTPSPSLTPLPTVTPSPELEHHILLTEWPSYCVKNTIGEQLILQLQPTDTPIACLNPQIYEELNDFSVEWSVRIDGVAAIVLVGDNNFEYWLAVLPLESKILFQIVEKENGEFKDINPVGEYPVSTLQIDELHTIQFVRTGSEIAWYINKEEVYVGEDILFQGENTNIQIGVGVSGQAENVEGETIVTFDNVSIVYPVRE